MLKKIVLISLFFLYPTSHIPSKDKDIPNLIKNTKDIFYFWNDHSSKINLFKKYPSMEKWMCWQFLNLEVLLQSLLRAFSATAILQNKLQSQAPKLVLTTPRKNHATKKTFKISEILKLFYSRIFLKQNFFFLHYPNVLHFKGMLP